MTNRNDRKAVILGAAVDLAETNGYINLTRDRVAERAGVSMGLINHHFGDMSSLRHAVMREAIRRRVLSIIAQGLAYDDAIAQGAPVDLRREALDSLM